MTRGPLTANPDNCAMAELETAIKAAPTRASHRRMQAIKALLLGVAHDTVAELYNITRQCLLIWIKAFNAQGIDGLIEKQKSGCPRKIPAIHTDRLVDLLRDPDQADLAHWTAKKFHGHLREQLQLDVGYRTVVRWIHEQGFRLKVPQPWPDRQDEAAREAFIHRVKTWLADDDVDLWYQDEMGVEGDPRPRRRWAEIGIKARVTRNGDHLRMNVSGMICPRTGEAFLLEFTHSDREMFQAFLDEANKHVAPRRARNLLIMDNASWHKCKSIQWGMFEPIYLPPYSPDLNPIERLWLLIKAEWFCDFVAKDRQALIARLDDALNWAMNRYEGNQKTCAIH